MWLILQWNTIFLVVLRGLQLNVISSNTFNVLHLNFLPIIRFSHDWRPLTHVLWKWSFVTQSGAFHTFSVDVCTMVYVLHARCLKQDSAIQWAICYVSKYAYIHFSNSQADKQVCTQCWSFFYTWWEKIKQTWRWQWYCSLDCWGISNL